MDNSLHNRIIMAKKMMKKNLDKNKLKKVQFLGQGYQGTVYKYCTINCTPIAIKKIYLDEKESKYITDQLNKKALKYGNYIELASAKLINQILLQNISPNFIFNYSNNYIERNGICSDIYPYSSYHYNEFIGDSETYTEWVQKQHSIALWYNAYFQIVSAIYTLQKYFNMTHLDLHAANIIVKKVKKGGYWKYIIGNNSFYVPNLGYIFYIGDFGQAYIPELKRHKKVNNGMDISQLFRSTLHISVSSETFKKNIRKLVRKMKDSDISDILYEYWGNKYITKSKDIIETYNMNKQLQIKNIPVELQKYIK